MNNFLIIIKNKLTKKNIDSKQEALSKICYEQFEKLISRGLSLPIKLL
jgi:hypothetical protein